MTCTCTSPVRCPVCLKRIPRAQTPLPNRTGDESIEAWNRRKRREAAR